jgi:hypothetical protein
MQRWTRIALVQNAAISSVQPALLCQMPDQQHVHEQVLTGQQNAQTTRIVASVTHAVRSIAAQSYFAESMRITLCVAAKAASPADTADVCRHTSSKAVS